jgi:hypothetical protein
VQEAIIENTIILTSTKKGADRQDASVSEKRPLHFLSIGKYADPSWLLGGPGRERCSPARNSARLVWVLAGTPAATHADAGGTREVALMLQLELGEAANGESCKYKKRSVWWRHEGTCGGVLWP